MKPPCWEKAPIGFDGPMDVADVEAIKTPLQLVDIVLELLRSYSAMGGIPDGVKLASMMGQLQRLGEQMPDVAGVEDLLVQIREALSN